jgi:hypothetical protein
MVLDIIFGIFAVQIESIHISRPQVVFQLEGKSVPRTEVIFIQLLCDSVDSINAWDVRPNG